MSESGNEHYEESARALTDCLSQRASGTDEELSTSRSPGPSFVSLIVEGAEHNTTNFSGFSRESDVGLQVEADIETNTGQMSGAQDAEDTLGTMIDYRGARVQVGSSGSATSADQEVESISESVASGSRGHKTAEFLEGDLSKKTFASTSLPTESSRTPATNMINGDRIEANNEETPENVPEEGVEGYMRKLAFYGGLFAGPSSSLEPKKSPETLAVHRWKMAYLQVKRFNALKRSCFSTPIGAGARLDGHALGILSTDSEIRKILFNILYHQAEHVFLTSFHPTLYSLDAADMAITIIYTIESCCRIIILGFYRGPHAYLRNSFNRLDFVIIIDSWTHIITRHSTGQDRWIRLAVLRIFRALLVVRRFTFIGDIFAILDACKRSVVALDRFIILTLMYLSVFALFGVQLFGGIFHSRCYRTYDLEPSFPSRLCFRGWVKSYQFYLPYYGDNCNHGSQTGQETCMGTQYAKLQEYWILSYSIHSILWVGSPNPNYGVTHFDNLAASFLIVFQVITFEGWALIMNWARISTGLKSDGYFIFLVITGGYLIVNIYIAVICGTFLRVRIQHKVLGKIYRRDKNLSHTSAIAMASLLKEVSFTDDTKLTWSQRFSRKTTRLSAAVASSLSRQSARLRSSMSRAVDWNDPNSYIKRLSSFGLKDIEDFENGWPDDPAVLQYLSRNLSYATRFGRTLSRSLTMTGESIMLRISSKCWIAVHSKVFQYGVLFFISFNMAALCSLKAHMTREHSDIIHNLEIVMIVIFGMELLMRLIAGGLSRFLREKINVMDLVIVVISCWNTGPNRKFPNLTPVRMLHWFYSRQSNVEKMRGAKVSIVVALIRSVGNVASVYCFLLLIIVIFSVFSMELWGGAMDNFDDGYPRANHDSFTQAALLWFTVTTGESWVNYMWDVMRPGVRNRWIAPLVFIIYFIMTSFIAVNLIIATILEEIELGEKQKKNIQKREHLQWLHAKHYHHISSTRGSDWIINTVEGAQKSFMEARRFMNSMRVSRMSIFPVSRWDSIATPTQEQVTADTESRAEGPTAATTSQEYTIPTKRTSYSSHGIRGSTEHDPTISAAKGTGRSSVHTIPTSVQTLIRRRPSQGSEPLMLRSGFVERDLLEYESKTALQTALLIVVDEQAKLVADTKPINNTATGISPSRRINDARVSFDLSEFDTSPTFVMRQLPWWLNDRSLFLFAPENWIRVHITNILLHKNYIYFEYMFLILGHWDFFVLDRDYIYPMYMNLVYMIMVTLDIVLKSIAYGFLFTREGYMSDPYNWLDIINMISILVQVYTDFTKSWVRLIRFYVFGYSIAFRPLTIIGRFMGMRTLLANLIRTIPVLGQVFIFVLAVYAIFAVIGIQLYANRFRYCTDPSVEGHYDCVGLFRNEVGVIAVRTWVNPKFHFDNFNEAVFSLFVGSTFDNWPANFLFTAMDIAKERELQPQRNISPLHAIYFVIFMCVGGIFILRMFVGVFIDQFGVISGSKLLTLRQKLWRDTNRLIQGLNPKIVPTEPSTSRFQRFCFRVVYTRQFELTVVFVIIVNYLYMTTRHVNIYNNIPIDMYDDGGKHSAIETMFVSLYAVEASLKILGTRWLDWWDDKWNAMELVMFIISASCLYPGIISYIHAASIPEMPGIPGLALKSYPIRQYLGAAFMFVRIFRIIRYIPALKTTVIAIMISLPSMLDTIGLMLISVLCLMIIGLHAFGSVQSGSCTNPYGPGPSFYDISQAFPFIIQVMTLDNWSCLMLDISIKPPYCMNYPSRLSTCGKAVWGIIFMMVAVVLNTYIFANIFVVQILESITFGLTRDETLLKPADVIAFQTQWSKPQYDRRCTGYLGQHKLKEFFIELGYPLGGRTYDFIKRYTRIEYEVSHFRSVKGIGFRQLLETVCLHRIGSRGLELPVRIERERQIQKIYETGAALRIQALVRGFLQRRRHKRNSSDKAQLSTMGRGRPFDVDRSRQYSSSKTEFSSTSTSYPVSKKTESESSSGADNEVNQ